MPEDVLVALELGFVVVGELGVPVEKVGGEGVAELDVLDRAAVAVGVAEVDVVGFGEEPVAVAVDLEYKDKAEE